MESETKTSRVLRGLFSGLKTGLLVMGIFALVSASAAAFFPAAAVATAPSFFTALTAMEVIKPAIIGTIVSSLFGAANQLFSGEPESLKHAPHLRMHDARIQQASQTVVPLLVPGQSAAQSAERSHETTPPQELRNNWRDTVQRSDSRMHAILNNGELSGKSRAAAILAERERTANAQHSV